MAWSYVQSASVSETLSLAYPSDVQAGSLLVVVANTAAVAFGTCSDTRGNSYTLINNQAAGAARCYVWYTLNSTAGANTVSITTSASDKNFAILEYSGIGAFDSAVGQVGSGTAVSSGSCPVATPGSLVVGAWTNYSAAGIGGTPGAGFTQRLSSWAGSEWTGIIVCDATASSATDFTYTASSFVSWCCSAASFSTGGGGGGPVPRASWGLTTF